MTSAAIYARVSSARRKKDQTIGSQTEALGGHARQLGVELPEAWVFEDEGHSGATLMRPALERLRDLVAGAGVDVVLCYSSDRLTRKFAYRALCAAAVFAASGSYLNPADFVNGLRPALLALAILAALGALAGYAVRHPPGTAVAHAHAGPHWIPVRTGAVAQVKLISAVWLRACAPADRHVLPCFAV